MITQWEKEAQRAPLPAAPRQVQIGELGPSRPPARIRRVQTPPAEWTVVEDDGEASKEEVVEEDEEVEQDELDEDADDIDMLEPPATRGPSGKGKNKADVPVGKV